MNLKTILFALNLLTLMCSCMENRDKQSKEINESSTLQRDSMLSRVTLESLTFEPIVSWKNNFNPGGRLEKAYYGLSADTIQVRFTSDNIIKTFTIVEERSGRIIKSFRKVSDIDFSYPVQFENAFTVNIDFPNETYYNLEVLKKSGTVRNQLSEVLLLRDSVVVEKKTNRSISGRGLAFEKVFNEPKKFVVSRTLSMSGETKVYAPIEVPKNTVEFIYTLRISGSDNSISEDGKLFTDVSKATKKIKVLGLPLWESEGTGTSLSREILNVLFPPLKDEDYTLNVFFFDKDKEIKKFLKYPGKENTNAFEYDINNSALSTQSRVGLIKKPRSGFSYIGLQSTSTFTNTYAWLDVVALSEKSFEYEIRYRIIKK
jgi:hypothetical protein